MKYIAVLVVLVLVAPLSSVGRPGVEHASNSTGTLFAQSAERELDREFPNPNVSFLLLDARTGQLLASRWDNPETPIPLGSLAKPFAALAYGEQHDFRYPVHHCLGTATGCWRPDGHGDVSLTSAIAYSCNSYFRMLTADMKSVDISSTADRFGLERPHAEAGGAALAGLGPSWRISPLHMARAYIQLTLQHHEPAVRQILDGMADSAMRGTGAEVDRLLPLPNALVKTGTAACTHARHAPGDGFTVALVPADDPKLLLMVRVHGVPGAQAAKTAGQMLRRIEE